MNAEFVTLHFSDGRSDKIYQAAIKEVGTLFEVHFRLRHRGQRSPPARSSRPVSWDQALRIFERLVAEKMKEGLSVGRWRWWLHCRCPETNWNPASAVEMLQTNLKSIRSSTMTVACSSKSWMENVSC